MGIIRKILCATVFAAACASRLAAQSLPELPAFPVSPLGKADFEALAKSDTPEGWKAFAERSKKSAEDFFKRQLYDESASWIYTALAADMFAECGEEMPFELKSAILEDLPSFFDFYESMTPYDKPEGACKMLASIHSLYPVQFRKFRRAAYALSLIYDDEPPIDWPECNVPSNPTRMSVPTEIFFYFTENPSTLIFPLERLTVGELVWVMGVGGPMDELKGLRNPNITPYSVEKLASSIKTDMSRVSLGRFEPWPEGVPYTPDNIKKRGGAPIDKVYCAWRTANANGIPCVYFSYKSKTDSKDIGTAWFAYMARAGVWKYDVGKDQSASASVFDRPVNPQTWKPIQMFDLRMLERRHMAYKQGIYSLVFLRISEMLYKSGDYNSSAYFADKAKKANPENWKAYVQYIMARARFGASTPELDSHWRKAYEAFRKYPEKCVDIIGMYRATLARRNPKEGARIFIAEMRNIVKSDPALAVQIFSDELKKDFAALDSKNDIFPLYAEVMRVASAQPDIAYEKIAEPLIGLFAEQLDEAGAKKAFAIFESATRSGPMSPAKLDAEGISRAEVRRYKENPRRGGRVGGARQGGGVRKLARTCFRQAGN